jgi:hypothetical protein
MHSCRLEPGAWDQQALTGSYLRLSAFIIATYCFFFIPCIPFCVLQAFSGILLSRFACKANES